MKRQRRLTAWRLGSGVLSGVFLALAAGFLLLVAAVTARPRHGGHASRQPATPEAERRVVPDGVTLAGHAISGWREPDVRWLLLGWAGELRRTPVNARLDPATRGLIPPLNGLDLDVEGTLARVRAAAPGERLPLAFRENPPAVSLADLPPSPIYQGNAAKQAVTFLINVAWGEEHLPGMLRTLEQHRVRATFFLVGQWVERHPEAVKAIVADGHEIASHGYSSAEFAKLSAEQVADEIGRAETAIIAATGRKPRYFSPHKGEITPRLLRVARDMGYETILWSVDTVDWMKPGTDWMVDRVLSKAHNGALILMHPTDQTVEALAPMILGLRKQGYSIVTLGAMLSPSPLVRRYEGRS